MPLELGDRWAVTVLSSVVRDVGWEHSTWPQPASARTEPWYFYFFGTVKKRTERQISAQNTGCSGPCGEALGEMATGVICFGALGGTEVLPMRGLRPGGPGQSWACDPGTQNDPRWNFLGKAKQFPLPF